MSLTAPDYHRVLVHCGVRAATADVWAPALASGAQPEKFSRGMDDIIAWLPQILHESQLLERTRENLSYSAARIRELGMKSPASSRWRSLVARADELAHKPEAFAEACYGGRMGNRPEGFGDGARYPGRSPIMATGHDAYLLLGDLMGQDLTVNPNLLESAYYGVDAAVAWWEGHVPDALLSDTVQCRRRVNGGTFGLEHCIELAGKVKEAFEWTS